MNLLKDLTKKDKLEMR